MAWENPAIDLYVNQQLSIRLTALKLRGEGYVVSRVELTNWLRKNGFIRTSADARRGKCRAKPGIPPRQCMIPGCTLTFEPNSGSQKFCKTCIPHQQARSVWSNWQIAWPKFEELFRLQNGVCAGCKCVMTQGVRKCPTTLCVDHDHLTGEVRGLLCHRCNTTLGHVDDRADVLRALALYVEKRHS